MDESHQHLRGAHRMEIRKKKEQRNKSINDFLFLIFGNIKRHLFCAVGNIEGKCEIGAKTEMAIFSAATINYLNNFALFPT